MRLEFEALIVQESCFQFVRNKIFKTNNLLRDRFRFLRFLLILESSMRQKGEMIGKLGEVYLSRVLSELRPNC